MKQVEPTTPKPSLVLIQEEHCKHLHSAGMEIWKYHSTRILELVDCF